MQMTKKASYGLIAALELARSASEASPCSATAIASRYQLPKAFVEKILHELRIAGLVRSRKGRDGGYFLVAGPARISVREVLTSLDEPLDLVACLDGAASCELMNVCPTRGAWDRMNRQFREMLDSLSLQDLLEES